jgi:uncharacterized SAM-binding protein YcdF (DUF218 family)
MFFLKKLIAALTMPLSITLLLWAMAALFFAKGSRRKGKLAAGAGAMLILAAAWGPVADTLLSPLERLHPPLIDIPPYNNAAVMVLGSGYNQDSPLPITSRINDSGLVRLTEGIRIYRRLPKSRLVLSGGSVYGGSAAAHGYAEAALALGVPERDIVRLDTPRDTAEEALAAREILGPGQILILVTSASHMARAMMHFKKAGLSPVPAPTRHKSLREDRSRPGYWLPSSSHLQKTERAVYEYLGLLAVNLDH